MKLCIQIPCLNEEKTLGVTLESLPRHLAGISSIEVVVIDDGSNDQTVEIARKHGVKNIFRLKSRRGLARAFSRGIRECLSLGADIIVNLDGDNQYCASDIEKLVAPILDSSADIVLGARDFDSIQEFSRTKRFFQRLGSSVVSRLCNVKIPDAATGFRAFSRDAARKINVFTKYTYTLETLIQASQNGDRVHSVPIKTNRATRPSRLMGHPISYVLRSAGALTRLTVLYNPLRVLGIFAVLVILSAAPVLLLAGDAASMLLGVGLLLLGVVIFGVALVLDQISVNRRLLESLQLGLASLEESDAKRGRSVRSPKI